MQVSVIIPVYNAEKYVREAVESAIAQPETGEVIIVEDGSPDNSIAICQELEKEYSKVRLLQHPNGENRGAGASRNLGIKKAQCEFIAFLDADDVYISEHFKVPKKIFQDSNQVDGVYEAVGTFFQDEIAKEKWFSLRDFTLTTVTELIEPDNLIEALLTKNVGWFHTDGITVRRDIFYKTGYFDEQLEIKQDIAMFFKMATAAQLVPGRLETAVSMRRVHQENRWWSSPSQQMDKYLDKENYDLSYSCLFWKIMFNWIIVQWSKNKQITNQKVGLYIDKYLGNSFTLIAYKNKQIFTRKIFQLLLLFKIMIICPNVVSLNEFWNYMYLSIGLNRLK